MPVEGSSTTDLEEAKLIVILVIMKVGLSPWT